MEFIALSYNHARCIVEHLESIKHVIHSYADGEACVFRLFDDSSSDDTVKIADAWLEQNRMLFSDVEIISNTKNLGVAHNYTRALRSVRSNRFKILAGDDLYFDNNVFQIAEKPGLTLTQPFWFRDATVVPAPDIDNLLLFAHAQVQDALRPTILKKLRFENCISAPGAFLGKDLIDSDLLRAIEAYTYLEDYPMWSFLFLERTRPFPVRIDARPYVLYRVGSGVSTSHRNASRTEEPSPYELDVMKLKERYYPTTSGSSLPAKIKRAVRFYQDKAICKRLRARDKNTQEILDQRSHAEQRSGAYIESIQGLALGFIEGLQ
ncbi:glycosyltransferase family A protein [Adlercreutzia murintestinalis]|jgi:Glycosyltransferases involved in cell wall biogenesis|uniref:glycosyltransferase family A protein n=1 Tax=Adlercreutzia murintestinalis TaxID=2941325 RepID=UPI00203F48EC|nr:glycosyltransferase family A protein [Adlercreutzia murintestinalis]